MLPFIQKEFKALLPPTIFFLITFHLLALTESLMMQKYGITLYNSAIATIGALITAKAVLISEHLPFTNNFKNKPLVYNLLWKTSIYAIIAVFFSYLEHMIHYIGEYHNLLIANEKMIEEIVWSHFLATKIWLIFLLFFYCTIHEIVTVVGKEKLIEIFLHESPNDLANN
jgi:hypothetical protein